MKPTNPTTPHISKRKILSYEIQSVKMKCDEFKRNKGRGFLREYIPDERNGGDGSGESQ
jgi:hypothetical protein